MRSWRTAERNEWLGGQVGRELEETFIDVNLEHYVPRHPASAAADDDNETTAVLLMLVADGAYSSICVYRQRW